MATIMKNKDYYHTHYSFLSAKIQIIQNQQKTQVPSTHININTNNISEQNKLAMIISFLFYSILCFLHSFYCNCSMSIFSLPSLFCFLFLLSFHFLSFPFICFFPLYALMSLISHSLPSYLSLMA